MSVPNDQLNQNPGTPEPNQPAPDPAVAGEPGQPGTEPIVTPTVNADEVMAVMNQEQVVSTEQLANLINSGRDIGLVNQRLGDERKKVESLEAQLAVALQNQPTYDLNDPFTQPQQQPQPQAQPQAQNGPEDIKNAVKEVFVEMNQEQAEVQQKFTTELQNLAREDDFTLVGPVFGKWMNNPQTQARVKGGKSTLRAEYDFVSKNVHKVLLKQMSGQMDGVAQPTGQPTGQPQVNQTPQVSGQPPAQQGTVPFVEQGQSNTFNVPGQPQSDQQRFNTIVENQKTGVVDSDQALAERIKVILPELG